MKKDSQSGFLLYTEHKRLFMKLTAKDAYGVLMAIFDYVETGEEPTGLSEKADIVWLSIQGSLDRNKANYDRRCETSQLNGTKGGRPPKAQKTVNEDNKDYDFKNLKKPNKPNENLKTLRERDSKRERDSNSERENRKGEYEGENKNPLARSQNPTFEEVKKACKELGLNTAVGEKFYYHYEANGWTQGKDKPVLNWVAQLRSWAMKESEFKAKGIENKTEPYRDRKYSEDELDALYDDLEKIEF